MAKFKFNGSKSQQQSEQQDNTVSNNNKPQQRDSPQAPLSRISTIKRFSVTAQKPIETDYDHLIILKDNSTLKPSLSYATTSNFSETEQGSSTPNSLTHIPTNSRYGGGRILEKKDSLRRHLAERKYQRKWQNDEQAVEEIPQEDVSGGSDDEDIDSASLHLTRKSSKLPTTLKGKGRELQAKKDDLRKRGSVAYKKAKTTGRRYKRDEEIKDEVGEIDILYENQRGMFFFGNPLFSSKSLLPTDSSAWTNRFHRPSPVTIQDAQLPDPSWEWSWKSWFVDMTGDVDEEGWQYSLAFRGSKWHGVSVWWHGFVRRRRWVRKRVKRRTIPKDEGAAPHSLTPDYFTIHSRGGSETPEVGGIRGSSFDGRESYVSSSRWADTGATDPSEDDEEMENIIDIPTLEIVLKEARIDREKIRALDNFIHNGGEEVAYLAENIPQIMASMIFQTSRRHLLAHLLHVLLAVQAKRADDHIPFKESSRGNPSILTKEQAHYKEILDKLPPMDEEQEARYVDGLGRAVEAAEDEVRKLEYWSDIKKVEKTGYAGMQEGEKNVAIGKVQTPHNNNDDKEWIAKDQCMGHDGVYMNPEDEERARKTKEKKERKRRKRGKMKKEEVDVAMEGGDGSSVSSLESDLMSDDSSILSISSGEREKVRKEKGKQRASD